MLSFVDAVLRAAHAHFELDAALPTWPQRGISDLGLERAALCVRAGAEQHTYGFFVAR